MLDGFPIHATVAASDIERAKAWYAEKLDAKPQKESPGNLWYRFGEGSWLLVYQTDTAGTAQNTQAGWTVRNIERVVKHLRDRGVAFEDYDFGEMKTVDGILDIPGMGKAAWFKDSEGNTFELSEPADQS